MAAEKKAAKAEKKSRKDPRIIGSVFLDGSRYRGADENIGRDDGEEQKLIDALSQKDPKERDAIVKHLTEKGAIENFEGVSWSKSKEPVVQPATEGQKTE